MKLKRLQGGDVLGRLVYIKSSAGELHYLRLLLLHIKGEHALSFASLKSSASGDEPPSFQNLARELGLLQDDSETAAMLTEAVRVLTSTAKLSELIAETFVWLDVSDHAAIWNFFLDLVSAEHAPISTSQLYDRVNEVLHGYSMSLDAFGIARPEADTAHALADSRAREYNLELRSKDQLLEEQKHYDSLHLNADQQLAFDSVRSLVDNQAPPNASNVIFIDGPAGTGKTYLYRKVLHYVRSTRRIALAVAFSGIAALLLPGGRTAHSRFRLPVPLPAEGCTCNIKAQSVAARLLRDSSVIVFDEAPMCHKDIFSAVDTLLQELLNCRLPFGGKPVLLGGDWRQIPPVARRQG